MNELIQQIVQRTGISEEAATKAVNVVADFIKQRAPAPVASQVDQLLSGDASGSSMLGAAKGAFGGMFGTKAGGQE